MAIPKKRTAFFLCLILSTLAPPSNAMRHDGNFNAEDDHNFNTEAGKPAKCPSRSMRLNKTSKLCFYDYQPVEDSLEDIMKWSTPGSAAPLIFTAHHGVFQLEAQFLAEMANASGNKEVQLIIANDVAQMETMQNETFKKEFLSMHHKLHVVEENFKPGFFLLEHAAEHAIFEGLAIGCHALEHAAAAGTLVGEEALLASLEVGFGIAGGVFAVALEWILPILLIPQAMYMIWGIHKHLKRQTHHTKKFIKRLVFKSDCMEEKTRIKKEDVLDKPDFMKSAVAEVCGPNTAKMLNMQMIRTNFAMESIFTTMESLGRCLWPHNKRRLEKIDCAENIYWKLRQHENGPGILFAALSFAATYAAQADEILNEPFYGDHFEEEFGISVPPNISMMPKLTDVAEASAAVRASTCIQLVATHRAFERTFLRLETAIRVYVQSYARKATVVNIHSSWKPCQKVFFKLSDSDKGMCKHEDWHNGHGENEMDMGLDELSACNESNGNRTTLWPEEQEAEEKKRLKEEKALKKKLEKEQRKLQSKKT